MTRDLFWSLSQTAQIITPPTVKNADLEIGNEHLPANVFDIFDTSSA